MNRNSKPVLLSRPYLPLVYLLLAVTVWAGPQAQTSAPSASVNATTGAVLGEAREQVLNANPLAMFYFYDDAAGLASLQAHAGDLPLVAPQSYELDSAGALHGQLPPGVRELMLRAKIPLMPLVTNSDFDRAKVHSLLHDAKARERAAISLAQVAERDQYVGWQVDFEGIAPADRIAYTRFVASVAARLHHDHRLLSVAVPPRFSDKYPDTSGRKYRTGEWSAGFDFHGLGRAADFLVLMAYDQHTSSSPPGPVAGYDWVKAALDYAVRRVPPSKLLLGLPFYGREWTQGSRATTSRSLTYTDLRPFLEDPASQRHWDDLTRTTWFQLRAGETVRTAWFDDARSLHEKLRLVSAYHLRGYAAWRLGVEDPAFWQPQGP
jgi:spore germination protein YaaH